MSQILSSDSIAGRSFFGLVLTALVVFSVSLLGIALGINSLIVSTQTASDAVACCGTLFSRCLVSPSLARAVLPWIAMSILFNGVFRGCWAVVKELRAERLFLGQISALSSREHEKLSALAEKMELDEQLCLLPGPELHRVFTAGIRRPKIYITEGLCDRFSTEELEVVLLHENHHRTRKDPLRSLILLFVKELLFFVPLGSIVISSFNEAREEAADDAVLASNGDALELASALCQVARLQSTKSEVAGVSFAGGPIQKRVKRLLTGKSETSPKNNVLPVASSCVVVALLLVTLYMPLLMTQSPFVFQGCNPELCRSMGCM